MNWTFEPLKIKRTLLIKINKQKIRNTILFYYSILQHQVFFSLDSRMLTVLTKGLYASSTKYAKVVPESTIVPHCLMWKILLDQLTRLVHWQLCYIKFFISLDCRILTVEQHEQLVSRNALQDAAIDLCFSLAAACHGSSNFVT